MKLEESRIAVKEVDVDLILRKLDTIKDLLEHKAFRNLTDQKAEPNLPGFQRNLKLGTIRAAEYLKISRSQLYKLTMNGVLPFTKVGGKRKYSISDLDEYSKGVYFGVKQSILPKP